MADGYTRAKCARTPVLPEAAPAGSLSALLRSLFAQQLSLSTRSGPTTNSLGSLPSAQSRHIEIERFETGFPC